MAELPYLLAIWVPASMIGWVFVWFVAKLLGLFGTVTVASSDRYTINNWPFVLVLLAGAFFGLIGGVHEFAFGENSWTKVPVIAVAATATIKLVPRLWEYLFPPAAPPSQPGDNNARAGE